MARIRMDVEVPEEQHRGIVLAGDHCGLQNFTHVFGFDLGTPVEELDGGKLAFLIHIGYGIAGKERVLLVDDDEREEGLLLGQRLRQEEAYQVHGLDWHKAQKQADDLTVCFVIRKCIQEYVFINRYNW